ncbi:MAG: hypothetical protein QG659_154 [Patescibacteria group bacterium]|nr:hypothetical protein [Patescibacteria group bacterium]
MNVGPENLPSKQVNQDLSLKTPLACHPRVGGDPVLLDSCLRRNDALLGGFETQVTRELTNLQKQDIIILMKVLETEHFTIRPIEAADGHKLRYAVMDNRKLLERDFPNVVNRYMYEETALQSAARAATASADGHSGFSACIATDPDNSYAYGIATRDRLTPRQQRALRVVQAWHGTEYGGFFGVHSLVDVSLVAGWTARTHPRELPVQGLEHVLRNDSLALGACEVALSATLIRPENSAAINVASEAGMVRATTRYSRSIPPISALRQRAATLGDGIKKQPRELWVHASTNGHSVEKVIT